MLRFEDFFSVKFPDKTKVKFNMNAADANKRAWDFLLNGEDDPQWIGMNAHRRKNQNNNNLDKAEYLLAFAQYYPYGPKYYVFGGMYRVEKILPEVDDGIGYTLTLMDEFADYRKRLIIRLKEPIGRNSYNRWYNNLSKQLEPEVFELMPSTSPLPFAGYNNVCLTHRELQQIYRNEAAEWKEELSSVKGVYCITDTSNGELYIGSASGDGEGIWQRWKSYADVDNLTGGNKTFEDLKKAGANRIIDNFTYSILEIFDMRTKRDDIIHRESYWKKVFQTIQHGMNNN